VDANPYLVAATVLAGIRHGWAHQIDPGPETTGNGYEGAPDAPPIPVDWRMAIEAAKGSAFLKGALGEDMHRTFTAILEAEYRRVQRTVPDVDFDLYLYTV
jgi:glutamine synthetase